MKTARDVAIFLLDTYGRITTWNEGVIRLLGYTEAEFVGSPVTILFTPEDVAASVPQALLDRAAGHGSAPDARWYLRKDGSRFHGDGVLSRVQNEDGELLGYGIILLAADATGQSLADAERKQLLAEREQRTAELDAILSSMPDAVYVGDEKGIRECNQLAVEMLGFQNREELQKNVATLAHRIQTRAVKTGEILSLEEQPFIRALRGEVCVEEVSTRRVDTGEEVIVRCAAAPIQFQGRIVGAVAINTDITRQKHGEWERERLLGALQRSNEDLTDFAHVVAHDLQAPLRGVQTYTQLLARKYQGKLDATADDCIQFILDGVRGMENLIRAVLRYAEAGTEEAERKPVRVESVIDAVRVLLQPVLDDSRAEILSDEMPVVQADPVQLTQLFQNLIGNAVKYRKMGEPPRITISARQRVAGWLFSVKDNGIGIEARHFERIFQPLKRLHGKEIDGSGIGLAVCRRIVERHGGRLWVESEPGAGSTFYFTLGE